MSHYHIVATDDEPAIRKIMTIMLERAGYYVTTCKSGTELLDLLQRQGSGVDLILLDIKMPGISGLDLLKTLRIAYPRIPTVMVTAFGDLKTGIEAMRRGAADYLAKPVGQQELLQTVKDVLQQWKHSDHSPIEDQLKEALAEIQDVKMATLEAFSETIGQKDRHTQEHSQRVRTIAVAIGRALHYSDEKLNILAGGALLHDIGKIGIPEKILQKTGPLTNKEFALIKDHPLAGVRIAGHLSYLTPFIPIIRNHHERLDGTGYPDGLAIGDIPLEVRIITLADSFEAMTADRPYRPSLSIELAVEQLKLNSGTQFDPFLVDLFVDEELYFLPELAV